VGARPPGPLLVVFAKAPRPGRVKTRLAAGIGAEAALAFYRRTLAAVLGRLDGGGPWATLLAVAPDEDAGEDALWPTATPRVPQGPGDLGERMGRFLAGATRRAPVAIVGTDIPELGAGHVAGAFGALEGHDLVLGPAADGGYWLIGAGAPFPPARLAGVRWSTEHARADTLRAASGLRVALLGELEDVDDAEGYRRWLARAGGA
jgi:uncharacterized protein